MSDRDKVGRPITPAALTADIQEVRRELRISDDPVGVAALLAHCTGPRRLIVGEPSESWLMVIRQELRIERGKRHRRCRNAASRSEGASPGHAQA